jgi:C-terminal peptidase prc
MTKAKLMGLFLGMVASLVAALPVRAADKPAHSYAVLIGISEYGDKQVKPRPHAETDAKALYDLITNKDYLGVQPDHVRLLLSTPDAKRDSQAATHTNILQALHWVATEAGTDDLVLFAFIGQGAPLSDSGRLCYLASDSTLHDRSKNAVAAADIAQELDKLKSRQFAAFIDVDFNGFNATPEKMPDAALGTSPYKEFRGSDGKEDKAPAPGRVVFLATNGLVPSLDLKHHGLFTKVVLDGLKGAADKEGYEPDGLVTVDELVEYLEKQIPDQLRKYGKNNDEERREMVHVLESRSTRFVLTHNPAVTAKMQERLEKLAQLAKDHKVSESSASEGHKLLERMPKLKAYQDLRKEYERLVDGAIDKEEFDKARVEIFDNMKLKRSAAFNYAAKVIQATQVIRDNYVKEESQGDLVAWAVRGLYRSIDERVPADIRGRLDKTHDLSEPELTALLADVREGLGKREDLDNHKDIDISLQRMMAHLDPYTTYIDPEMLSRFNQDTTGNFRGIGIQIRENRTQGALQVVTPLKDSPAYHAGLKAGDLIKEIVREVDEEGNPLSPPEVISTKGMTTTDAVKKIQGKPGTKVKLIVQREGIDHPLEFEVTRDVIKIESVLGINRDQHDTWNYVLDPVNRICYVRLTSFAKGTFEDLKRVMKKLEKKGINGFILDLRFNPGGLLTSAVDISDLFVDDGLIVTIKPRVGREAPYTGNHDGSYLNFPMVCLVNGMSASGSEIVSACLQDHERALIMGERSYGKGSVQNIQPFEGGELKLTTASFWRPSGKNLNKAFTQGRENDEWGVTPNKGFALKLSEKEREQLYEHQKDSEIIPRRDVPVKKKEPEFRDRQLEMALEYLRSQIKTAEKLTTTRREG